MSADDKQASLYAALARARAAVKPVSHDAQNKFHGYKYTSAEAVIGECSRVLAAEGLSLVPTQFQHEPKGGGAWSVHTQWILVHEGGGQLFMARSMHAEEGKGRPADKALLVANTSLLAYQLRDLCGLQRPDTGDEVAARDDTSYEPKPRAQRPAPRPTPRPAPQKPRKAPQRRAEPPPADDIADRAREAIQGAVTPGRLAAVRDRVMQQVTDDDARASLLEAVTKRHSELVGERTNGMPAGRHRASQSV